MKPSTPNTFAAAHTACILLAAAVDAAEARISTVPSFRAPVLEALNEAKRLAAQIAQRLAESVAIEPGTVTVYPSGLRIGEGITVPRGAVALAPSDALHVCIVEPDDLSASHAEAVLCEILHRGTSAETQAQFGTTQAESVITPSGTVEPMEIKQGGSSDATRVVLVEDDLAELTVSAR